MSKCLYCGKEHPDQAKFCPITGKPLSGLPPKPIPHKIVQPEKEPANVAQLPNAKVARPNLVILVWGIGFPLFLIGIWLLISSARDTAPQTPSIVHATVTWEPTGNIYKVAQAAPGNSQPATIAPLSTEDTKPVILATEVLLTTTTSTPTPVFIAPTATFLPTPTETYIPAFPTKQNQKDNTSLVFVPEGSFTMGSNPSSDPYFWGAESPQHKVTLDAYWIYQTEVTNAMYQKCADEKACPVPTQKSSRTRDSYYLNSEFDNYPVVYVTWTGASAYCTWAGGRLPTEAEWEKAARGDQDTRLFPWGDTPANTDQANFCDKSCPINWAEKDKDDGYADTAPVGSYPAGISPVGALDMAGNVWEWVADWYKAGYSKIDATNPLGPVSGVEKALRGGSWLNPSSGIRVVQRDGERPSVSLESLGFRCVVEDK